MKSRHNTLRALAIGLGLTLLVVTGTAAMMAAFSGPPPATDIYRRLANTPVSEPVTAMATAHDSVLYERVVLADGKVQWVLIEAPGATLATRSEAALTLANSKASPAYSDTARPVSYTLVIKPTGLSKSVTNCSRSAYGAYDIACNTMI